MNGMGENTTTTLKGLYKEQYPSTPKRKKKKSRFGKILKAVGSSATPREQRKMP